MFRLLDKEIVKILCSKYLLNWTYGLTDCLDMTIAVDWDIKPQTKQISKQLGDICSTFSVGNVDCFIYYVKKQLHSQLKMLILQ